MRVKKRLLAVLMCVIMVMGMLPVIVQANTDTLENPADSVYIWGEKLDSVDKYYHNGSNGAKGTINTDSTNANAHYDPNTGELTLTSLDARDVNTFNEFSYYPEGGTGNIYSAIFTYGDIEIVLNGNSFVSTKVDGIKRTIAVCIGKNLVFSGDGTLTATGGDSDTTSVGVQAFYDITVGGDVSITGIGGESDNWSYGVHAGDITVNSGRIAGIGGANSNWSIGVCADESIIVGGDGSIAGTGSDADGSSYGVYADESITVSGTSALAKGYTNAINRAPILNDNSANASVNYDGSELVPYDPDNIDTYKYFCILSNETPAPTATSEVATPTPVTPTPAATTAATETSASTASTATPAATANATANATTTPSATLAPTATATPQNAVARVSKVKLKNLKGKSILVKWSTVKGAVKYKVWYATKKSFPKKLTKSCVVKTNKATLKKLKKGLRYYIRIKAVNKQGKMSAKYSSVKSVKVKK